MTPIFSINPAFKSLIPPLAPEERSQLEANLVAEGCRDPLVVWRGILIDGHNRYEICNLRHIPYKTTTVTLEDEAAVKLWIIDNQSGRRNLSDIDRIALQEAREGIVAGQARVNELSGKGADGSGGRGRKKNPSAKLPKGLDTRKECAKAAGVGERTYDAGKLILEAARNGEVTEEVVEEVRRKKKSIHRVAKDIKEKRQRDDRQKKRTEAAASAPESVNSGIIIGDFRTRANQVADGSLSLIFTDPPYNREASKLLPDLAEFAAAKLAEGGSLICYVGQTQLPAALDAFRSHLRYWWTIACIHSGGATVMREYGVNAGWKAVLWFVKATRDNNEVFVSDVMSGGKEKSHHDWQQAQSEAEYWIEKLCPEDGLVCDPFLGGGTTAAAAIARGRRWVGFEIDEDAARIASGRISK